MISNILLYCIKTNCALALFFGVYYFFLRNDTFFTLKRYYFLFSILVSFVFPFIKLHVNSSILPIQENFIEFQAYINESLEISEQTNQNSSILYLAIFGLIISIYLFLFSNLLLQITRIIKLRHQASLVRKIGKTVILQTNQETLSPFSFFRWIFIDTHQHNEDELSKIIAHEKIHAAQWHSVDVMLSQFVCFIFWWNPIVWLLQKQLKANLEYLVDRKMTSDNTLNIKTYQYLLLKNSNKKTAAVIINNFNVSQLKKRIQMMNKKESSKGKLTSYLLLLPVLCCLALFNAEAFSEPLSKELANLPTPSLSEIVPINKAETTLSEVVTELTEVQPQQKDSIYTFSKKSPKFPGGEDEMRKHIKENLNFPESEKTKGGGRVFVYFVVRKNGKITDAKVVKGVSPALDAEALRVIEQMPNWIPGENEKGEKVSVSFTMPIRFLTAKDDKTKE